MKNFTKLLLIMLLTGATLGMQAQYCIPPPWLSGPFTGIVNVTLGTLSNSSTINDGGLEVYTYFNSVTVPSLTVGQQYTINATIGGGASENNSRVWIDYNQDDDFDDPGEEIAAWNLQTAGPLNQNFTVPAGASTGTTRMRVYTDMSVGQGHILPIPCGYNTGLGQHGEVEDYDVDIAAPPGLNINMTTTDANCGGSNGTATATATTGAPPYDYQWDAAANNQTNQQATALAAGTYSVTVTDNLAVTGTAIATVNNPNPPTVPTSVTDVTVFGGNDGTATANPTGGTPGYTYLWDAAAANQTTQQAIGLIAGTYSVTVTDAANCTGTGSAFVDEPIGIQETGKPSNGLFVYLASDDVLQIGFEISENARVVLDVYNVLGQRVLEIENGMKNPGEYRYTLDKTQLGNKANIYFVTLRVDDTIITKKFALR